MKPFKSVIEYLIHQTGLARPRFRLATFSLPPYRSSSFRSADAKKEEPMYYNKLLDNPEHVETPAKNGSNETQNKVKTAKATKTEKTKDIKRAHYH